MQRIRESLQPAGLKQTREQEDVRRVSAIHIKLFQSDLTQQEYTPQLTDDTDELLFKQAFNLLTESFYLDFQTTLT